MSVKKAPEKSSTYSKQVPGATEPTELTAFSPILEFEGESLLDLSYALFVF